MSLKSETRKKFPRMGLAIIWVGTKDCKDSFYKLCLSQTAFRFI